MKKLSLRKPWGRQLTLTWLIEDQQYLCRPHNNTFAKPHAYAATVGANANSLKQHIVHYMDLDFSKI